MIEAPRFPGLTAPATPAIGNKAAEPDFRRAVLMDKFAKSGKDCLRVRLRFGIRAMRAERAWLK